MDTKLHRPKFALGILGAVYAASLALMLFAGPGTSVAMVSAGVQVCIPYLVPFAWIGGIESRAKYFDPIWVKVAMLIAAAVYAALSVSWASSVLNQAFGVPASNFPVAHALIAIAYLPAELLGPVVSVSIVILSVSVPFVFLWALLGSKGWRQALTRFVVLAGVATYLGFVLGSTMFLQRNKVFLAQIVAVSLDFDSAHRCENILGSPDVKVAAVGDGNVLVFKGRTSKELDMAKDFELRKCQVQAGI